MARRKQEWTHSKLERFQKEGRGQGAGKDYVPWVKIQDFPFHRFNSISRINSLANIRREGKERNNPLPVIQPRLTNSGILFVPTLSKFNEGLFRLRFSSSRINRL